jgi:extracellular matrix regulatory protein A
MGSELIHIGFGNVLAMNRVIAIASPCSSPIKRTILEGKNKGLLIDMTSGRKTKAVIFTDSEHIILAALAPETIASRLINSREGFSAKIGQEDESEKSILVPS